MVVMLVALRDLPLHFRGFSWLLRVSWGPARGSPTTFPRSLRIEDQSPKGSQSLPPGCRYRPVPPHFLVTILGSTGVESFNGFRSLPTSARPSHAHMAAHSEQTSPNGSPVARPRALAVDWAARAGVPTMSMIAITRNSIERVGRCPR